MANWRIARKDDVVEAWVQTEYAGGVTLKFTIVAGTVINNKSTREATDAEIVDYVRTYMLTAQTRESLARMIAEQ